MERKIHHTTDMKQCCIVCGKPFKMMWYNKDETNGRSERMHGLEGKQKHAECIENLTGKPPLSLQDLNHIREKGITQDEYYKSKGY